jgi:hypothetical protein
MELISDPGDLVVDPYCGSGTTLLEASLSRRKSVGIDLNPLAVLIAKVKTTPIKVKVLSDFARRAEARLRLIEVASKDLKLLGEWTKEGERLLSKAENDFRWKDEWFSKWFAGPVRRELIAIHQQILQEEQEDCRNVALAAFSDILRQYSNAHSGYPNVMFDKNKKVRGSVTPTFIRKLRDIIEAVGTLQERLAGCPIPEVRLGDASTLPFDDESVDAIVTHPPYVGSIPYAEYGALSLKWLGHDPRELDRKLTGGVRQSKDVLTRFESGFRGMISECRRILRPQAWLFMLLGNPTVKGNRVDIPRMADELAHEVGFEQAIILQRGNVNRRANLMGREKLLFFKRRS